MKKLPNYLITYVTLTEKCNFKCKYCFEDYNPYVSKNLKDLSVDTFINSYDKLLNSTFLKVNNFDYFKIYFWGGDCLLKIDEILHILNYYNSHPKITFQIITNGLLLLNYIDKLDPFIKSGKLNLRISYDGLTLQNIYRPLANGYSSGNKIRSVIIKLINELKYKHPQIKYVTVMPLKQDTHLFLDTLNEFIEFNNEYDNNLWFLSYFKFDEMNDFEEENLNDTFEKITNVCIDFYKKHNKKIWHNFFKDRITCFEGIKIKQDCREFKYVFDSDLPNIVRSCPVFLFERGNLKNIINVNRNLFNEYDLKSHVINTTTKCNKCDILVCENTCKFNRCKFYKFFDKFNKRFHNEIKQ